MPQLIVLSQSSLRQPSSARWKLTSTSSTLHLSPIATLYPAAGMPVANNRPPSHVIQRELMHIGATCDLGRKTLMDKWYPLLSIGFAVQRLILHGSLESPSGSCPGCLGSCPAWERLMHCFPVFCFVLLSLSISDPWAHFSNNPLHISPCLIFFSLSEVTETKMVTPTGYYSPWTKGVTS